MIAVIDSGVANLASVMAALGRLNVKATVTKDAAEIQRASHVILPGVGAASAAMAQLRAKNLVDVIRILTQPVLGICLGMQVMFEHSEEGDTACLGVIPGKVMRMLPSTDMPVPHMGWNQIKVVKHTNPLLHGLAPDSFVYFVHGFAAPIAEDTVATTEYNGLFTAIVAHKNFYGCQFHPERSSGAGSQILQNFLGLKA